jgi:hypothetical protein
LRRRSAIEPIIGHRKTEGHLGRCYLKGRAGDAANVILSAAGYNFRRILAWFKELLALFLALLSRSLACRIERRLAQGCVPLPWRVQHPDRETYTNHGDNEER